MTRDNSDLLCIDLCSGTANFSIAFKNAGWEVITIDIDERCNPTIIMDIRYVSLERIEMYSKKHNLKAYKEIMVLASPPCERYSVANHDWPRKGILEALEIVGVCLELIVELKEKYPNFRFWALENPRGRLRWFLGKPRDTIRLADYGTPYQKLTDVWGNIPFKMLEGSKKHTMHLRPHKRGKDGKLKDYLRSDKKLRAKMPEGLSQAILEAVSN